MRDLIHGEKMRDFTVEFLKYAKFHGKFTGSTAVISRCYVIVINVLSQDSRLDVSK